MSRIARMVNFILRKPEILKIFMHSVLSVEKCVEHLLYDGDVEYARLYVSADISSAARMPVRPDIKNYSLEICYLAIMAEYFTTCRTAKSSLTQIPSRLASNLVTFVQTCASFDI